MAVAYKSIPVKIDLSEVFVAGTVQASARQLEWRSQGQQGSIDLVKVFKDMKSERGFLVADEAHLFLPKSVQRGVNPDLLVLLTAQESSIFILFDDWDIFESWVNGKT